MPDAVKYDSNGLIPAVIQDCATGEVLMVAYMNETSLAKTLAEGKCCYWSRSRKKLWMKGETSGHTQQIKQVTTDCDYDTLLYVVDQKGPACHTGEYTCFHNKLKG